MLNDAQSIPERASDDEALRLVVAFYCIMEKGRRNEVISLAEKYAARSEVVDGRTHFLLLDPKLAS